MRILKNPNIDFLGKRWIGLGISTTVIVGGMAAMVMAGGLLLGIDFAGGSQIVVHFSAPPDVNDLRDLEKLFEDGWLNAELGEQATVSVAQQAQERAIDRRPDATGPDPYVPPTAPRLA